jgi:hypothetical protein
MEGAGCRDKRRGTKRTREESDDTKDDTINIHLEVTTGEGVTVKLQLPSTATVLMVKQEVESELGIRPREACIFSSNKAHTEKLPDEETLNRLLVGEEAKLELLLLVEQADAQQVVPELAAEPSMVLGDGTVGNGDTQLSTPLGAAFIGAHPDWLVPNKVDIASRSAASALERWSASSANEAPARDSFTAQLESRSPPIAPL